MPVTDKLVLRPDVLFIPLSEMDEATRQQLGMADGFALTRPKSRTPSKVLDDAAAKMVRHFKEPMTIAEAVVRYSLDAQKDTSATLDEAIPLLDSLLAQNILVEANQLTSDEIVPSLDEDASIAGFKIKRVVQLVEDTEVYEVYNGTQTAALKIVRPGASPNVAMMLSNERSTLEKLDLSTVPRCLASGLHEERPYLLLQWIEGFDLTEHASQIRTDRNRLLELCQRIMSGYADLHTCGVLHGDVHARNVLVDEKNNVSIIDFGLSAPLSGDVYTGRGGVGYFLEPEFATAYLAGHNPPQLTPEAEQYSIAALIYLILTGAYYADFSLRSEIAYRQIIEDAPRSFVSVGAHSMPHVEAVLAKALAKTVTDRFSNLIELRDAFDRAIVHDASLKAEESANAANGAAFVRKVVERYDLQSENLRNGLKKAPTATVKYGAAGIAFALYRISCSTNDPELLALSEAWLDKAFCEDEVRGYVNAEVGIDKSIVGEISPFHSPSGLFVVQACIAAAAGNIYTNQAAIAGFLQAIKKECDSLDVTLGKCGILLAGSFLLDTCRWTDVPTEDLRATCDDVLAEIWKQLDLEPEIAQSFEKNIGIAHGWGGFIYASLMWCEASGSTIPTNLRSRLDELMQFKQPAGSGVRWPWFTPQGATFMPGWCNGSGGMVFLWTLAFRHFKDVKYLDLAIETGVNAADEPPGISSLCCGIGGRAYSLINLYRTTCDLSWLEKAKLASQEAMRLSHQELNHRNPEAMPDSLYKADVGIAVLAADMLNIEQAHMPFFERWPDLALQ